MAWALLASLLVGGMGVAILVLAVNRADAAAMTDRAPTDAFCVSLPEARSVLAGEHLRHALTRVAPEARLRYDTPHSRDVDGCGRNTLVRYRFHMPHKAIRAWSFLACPRHQSCHVVERYP
jgi:hypothetical protein